MDKSYVYNKEGRMVAYVITEGIKIGEVYLCGMINDFVGVVNVDGEVYKGRPGSLNRPVSKVKFDGKIYDLGDSAPKGEIDRNGTVWSTVGVPGKIVGKIDNMNIYALGAAALVLTFQNEESVSIKPNSIKTEKYSSSEGASDLPLGNNVIWIFAAILLGYILWFRSGFFPSLGLAFIIFSILYLINTLFSKRYRRKRGFLSFLGLIFFPLLVFSLVWVFSWLIMLFIFIIFTQNGSYQVATVTSLLLAVGSYIMSIAIYFGAEEVPKHEQKTKKEVPKWIKWLILIGIPFLVVIILKINGFDFFMENWEVFEVWQHLDKFR